MAWSLADWLNLMETVCEIDSRTGSGTGEAAGTTQVAREFGRSLASMGFSLAWHDTLPEEGPRGRHLWAERPPESPSNRDPTLLLLGHTDTVLSPAEVPFSIDRGRQRAFGAGTCDMKGCCVLMLAAVEQALRNRAVRQARLIVLLNSSEEIAGPSFPRLARQAAAGRDVRACLSFESARLGPDGEHQIVVSRKGVRRFTLTCRGRAAHSGIDHAFGVSAIRELARKIEALESLTDDSRDLTLNVGIVHGGNAVNQIADQAVAMFDLRAYDPAVLEEAGVAVRRLCAQPTVASRKDGRTTELQLDEFASYPAWPRRDSAVRLGERYAAIARRHGIKAVSGASGGGADPSHVSDLLPTLDGLGLVGGGLHQESEWADLASMPARIASVADLIIDLCAGPGLTEQTPAPAAAPRG